MPISFCSVERGMGVWMGAPVGVVGVKGAWPREWVRVE